jgi:hypothetical protein
VTGLRLGPVDAPEFIMTLLDPNPALHRMFSKLETEIRASPTRPYVHLLNAEEVANCEPRDRFGVGHPFEGMTVQRDVAALAAEGKSVESRIDEWCKMNASTSRQTLPVGVYVVTYRPLNEQLPQ